MKKLVAITALGLSLGFSSLSFPANHMDLYTNASSISEVKSGTKGGEIETSPMSFYLSPVKAHTRVGTLETAEETENEESTLFVFGVRI
ncbi:MAG: hypothetical protein RIG61_01220 [Deltaproteobacteria bacterium]